MIELDCVGRLYDGPQGPTTAVASITLEVARGEFLLLSGASGAGKSTLLGIMGLLVRPTSGRVILDGRRVDDLGERERDAIRGANFGIVPQHPRLLMDLTAVENVETAANNRHARASARSLIEKMGIGARADHRAGLLSGGESQRLSLARALVNEPLVILADEPTSGLDDINAAALSMTLAQLAAEGAAVVVASHDSRMHSHVTRRLEMKAGQPE